MAVTQEMIDAGAAVIHGIVPNEEPADTATAVYNAMRRLEPDAAARSQFAAAALQGMLAYPSFYKPSDNEDWHLAIVQHAFRIADAMLLAARP